MQRHHRDRSTIYRKTPKYGFAHRITFNILLSAIFYQTAECTDICCSEKRLDKFNIELLSSETDVEDRRESGDNREDPNILEPRYTTYSLLMLCANCLRKTQDRFSERVG